MDFSEIISVVNPELDEVEQELELNIKSPVPLVYEISKYLLGSGGKRLRPSVVLLASGACGLTGGAERVYAGAALELIHTATLLHDDVVDEANLRRGRPASNVVWGNKATVLVGDFMLARSLGLIQACGSLELIKAVTDAAARLAEGQVLEVMSASNMLEVSEEVCFGIIENKTASLIESCGRVGAVLAGADEGAKSALSAYGFDIGVAFQLVDDALDYSSTEKEFGKGVGQDLVEGKMTLPLLYSLGQSTEAEREKADAILSDGDGFSDEDLAFVRGLVDKYRGVDRTIDAAKDFIHKARTAASALPENGYKKSLLMLADYVAERKS
ncbi:MAG TPA: polyprenyl synthetase family protein [Thermodesulfobacteriota bacterium]|nr:polyprenyl synthetase family protein [Thermodesulfobacteriota bacterium]